MKKIDIYIIRKFLGTYIYAIALIISIAVVFDFSEKLDDFLERKAPIKAIIFDYYLNFIPYYANLFSALFTFISVIFFTSKLAYNYEIVAMLSSGISYRRIMFPYFISALIISASSVLLINYVIPSSTKVRLEFENIYYRNPYRFKGNNIHKQILPGEFIYMERYNNMSNEGFKFSFEKYEDNKLKYKIMSDFIRWDTTNGHWTIHNYYARTINERHEIIEEGIKKDTILNITPSDFSQRENIVESMTYTELETFIKKKKLEGTSIEAFLIEKYRRFAYPFSTFILTLIGVSIATRLAKGGTGMHIGLGLLLSAAYMLFMQISSQFAISGSVNPMLAVWIPNIVFLIIGFVLYKIAPK